MHKTDSVRISLFSDYPKKGNGTQSEINFDSPDFKKNLDDAIRYLKQKKVQLNELKK